MPPKINERKFAVKQKRDYLERFRQERKYLERLASQCQTGCADFHFVATDKMGPWKLPHMRSMPKGLLTVQRPKFHLYGFVNLSVNQRSYFDCFDW